LKLTLSEETEIIEEDNGTYAVVCSALGVYSVGRTLREAKRNFQQARDLHLSVLREKATSHAVRAEDDDISVQ
jgi:predicted RNase H-like HicB family nuclease